jgi:hypothetical protein
MAGMWPLCSVGQQLSACCESFGLHCPPQDVQYVNGQGVCKVVSRITNDTGAIVVGLLRQCTHCVGSQLYSSSMSHDASLASNMHALLSRYGLNPQSMSHGPVIITKRGTTATHCAEPHTWQGMHASPWVASTAGCSCRL